MIDTSRHFLPIQDIKHTIDALMYNKLSILHWHITD
jgi:hexosaminidase